MSKVSAQVSTSKGAIPKQRSKASAIPGAKGGVRKDKKDGAKETVEWQLPAFSIAPQKQKEEINWEKIKKDMVRRHAPEGEDINEIRRILKEIKNMNVPVHELINMVSPYTSDNGATLRAVMAEDLEAFRALAKKVYETMTQDVSDVLVNEQLQMVQYYEQKHTLLADKMMRAINDIFEMAPDFDFERYLHDKENYLQMLFPLPKDAEMTDEAYEMVKRQQAYHRLQWLRSEGDRMAEENKRLMRRLEELKREQQEEQDNAAQLAAKAEAKRQQLALEEDEKKQTLEKLNESIEKSFIREEAKVTKEHNRTAREPEEVLPMSKKSTGAIPKGRPVAGTKLKTKTRRQKRPEWSSVTAADIEDEVVKEVAVIEASKSIPKSTKGRSRSPHFSPVKTPPQRTAAPRQASPFHYSPPKTPPQEQRPAFSSAGIRGPEELDFGAFGRSKPVQAPRQTSPFHYSPPRSPPQPQMQQTVIEQTTTTVQQTRPQPTIRQSRAPRDTWGGFY